VPLITTITNACYIGQQVLLELFLDFYIRGAGNA
jgi:hypothetical protein